MFYVHKFSLKCPCLFHCLKLPKILNEYKLSPHISNISDSIIILTEYFPYFAF